MIPLKLNWLHGWGGPTLYRLYANAACTFRSLGANCPSDNVESLYRDASWDSAKLPPASSDCSCEAGAKSNKHAVYTNLISAGKDRLI